MEKEEKGQVLERQRGRVRPPLSNAEVTPRITGVSLYYIFFPRKLAKRQFCPTHQIPQASLASDSQDVPAVHPADGALSFHCLGHSG